MNSIMGVPYQTTYWNEIGTNPVVLVIITVIIVGYYALFATLGVAKGQPVSDAAASAGKGIVFLEVLLWGVFVLLILMNGMTYIFNMDITASVKNLFSAEPTVDIIVDPDNIAGDQTDPETTVPEIKLSKQVFHVPDNKYGYEDAKAICTAYGGRLATWKEMSEAYEKGADWCSFGWSDGQWHYIRHNMINGHTYKRLRVMNMTVEDLELTEDILKILMFVLVLTVMVINQKLHKKRLKQ